LKKEKTDNREHTIIENVLYTIGMIRKLDRLLLTAMLVSALTGVVLAFFGIYLPK
jgi:hypothetical protein